MTIAVLVNLLGLWSGTCGFRQDPPDGLRSFARDRRLVAAVYFIGYDAESGAGVLNGDGTDALRDHPVTLRDFSSLLAGHHRAELEEMTKYGVDIALVVCRGGRPGPDPTRAAAWQAIAEALQSLEKDRKAAPCVAPFWDGPAAAAAESLVRDIREFQSAIPARFRAAVEGRPLVVLGPVTRAMDPAVVREFRSALGGEPHVIADVSWGDVPAQARFQWGAAAVGPDEGDVISVGPGCDAGIPARRRAREEGLFYERAWYVALRMAPRMVIVETWNGFHEASEVCASREHGRRYLEITERASAKFHKGEQLPGPKGRFTGSPRVLWNLKLDLPEQGLKLVETPDGLFGRVDLAGVDVVTTKQNDLGTVRRLHFDADDSWLFWDRRAVIVEIEYFDQGTGSFTLEYDSADPALRGAARAAKRGGERFYADTKGWRTASFTLPDARFGGRQPGGADFRLSTDRRGLILRKVAVRFR